jgi:60Kd inner membrane protein
MVGLTFFQTFQMQRASPQGAQSSQQQTITRIMPLMFAFFGLTFPAGLVLYWTVSNALQIGQQTYLLKKGHIGPEALARQIELQKAKAQNPKRGVMSWMTDRATAAQRQRDEIQKKRGPKDKGASGQRTRGAGGTSSKKAPRPKKPSGNGSAGSAKEPPPPTQRRKGSAPGNQLRRNPQPDPPEDDG